MDTIDNRVIELTELRIGNFLLYKGDLVCVTMISCDIDDEYQETIGFVKFGTSSKETANWNRSLVEDLKRIAITPEWLESLGFVKEYSAYLQGGIYMYEGPGYWNNQKGWPVGLRDEISMRIVRCVDYVHQLQNLYFSLIGEELPIKQPV